MGKPRTSTLVIGGTIKEGVDFIGALGLDPRQFRVAGYAPVKDLRCCRNLPIILVGTYASRCDYDELMREIEIRDCHICAKIEDW